MKYIKFLDEVSMKDILLVGGKNASLGEMKAGLAGGEINIPPGFAITSDAYWYFINQNNLLAPIKGLLNELTDYQDLKLLKKIGGKIRSLIENSSMPKDLQEEIQRAYEKLSKMSFQENCLIAVRSSATAEDLPYASFAGQQESFLNVKGTRELIKYSKKCMASLFTDRAIVYREEHGFDHLKIAISVGVQKMIRSDLASAGTAFSLDTESGFKDVIIISSSYGLGELVVKGSINPDEFWTHKPTLKEGFKPIIKKVLGGKRKKMIYHKKRNKIVRVKKEDRNNFSLKEKDILLLSKYVLKIEKYYSDLKGSWAPVDVEWAKDGIDGKIYIVQSRPETIHANKKYNNYLIEYKLLKKRQLLVKGMSIGQKIVSGRARVIKKMSVLKQFKSGDILVTKMTNPDWVPIMKKASGIITDLGGRTAHAAIVSRELEVPAIVGTVNGTKRIKDNEVITIDCSQGQIGYVYQGKAVFKKIQTVITDLPKPPVPIMMNAANPDNVFKLSFLPNAGVGLARIEFIISNMIKVHPMALLHPEKIINKRIKKQIDKYTVSYSDKKSFFIDLLAQGASSIAAAFYPKPVVIRFSDFKSNEYRNLIGGKYFEPIESNPMLGLRGASRYISKLYKEAFELECKAMKKAREEMGFDNIILMIPFVRTMSEAVQTLDNMAKYGLKREQKLKIFMMLETPSNILLFKDFADLFDGFSIGSNDLTQLILGVDRDSNILSEDFNERNPSVKMMLKLAISSAAKNKKYISICGQAPSDFFDLARYLISLGISSLSLNSDIIIPFLKNLN